MGLDTPLGRGNKKGWLATPVGAGWPAGWPKARLAMQKEQKKKVRKKKARKSFGLLGKHSQKRSHPSASVFWCLLTGIEQNGGHFHPVVFQIPVKTSSQNIACTKFIQHDQIPITTPKSLSAPN